MPDTIDLSDKAIAIFAFAAYHQLTSGQPIKSVVREDGNGHKADDEAVHELEERELANVSGSEIAFSDGGLKVLASAIEGLKSAAKTA